MTRGALGDAGEQPLAAAADDRGGWQSLVDPISTQSAVALHPAIFALARRTPFTTLGPQADSFPRHAKNDEDEKSSRSGVDFNHLTETGGMAQGAESLKSIRSMVSLLHDDPRQDGEGCPVDM